jgi:thioredoxin 1
MKILKADEFSNAIQGDLVLIDFYADWCMPCKMIAPILEQVAEASNEFQIYKLNVDDNGPIAMKYNVRSIPTLAIFKKGVEVERKLGFMSKPQLESWLAKNR